VLNAPAPNGEDRDEYNPNIEDPMGRFIGEVLSGLASHLSRRGRLYMSCPASKTFDSLLAQHDRLEVKVLERYWEGSPFGFFVYEIRVKQDEKRKRVIHSCRGVFPHHL